MIIDKQLEESQDDNQEDMENEHQGFAAQHLSDQQNVKHQVMLHIDYICVHETHIYMF